MINRMYMHNDDDGDDDDDDDDDDDMYVQYLSWLYI